MIKVLFDLTGWQTNGRRGIGRYTINFAQSLVQRNDIDLSFIYTKRWNLTDLPSVITEYPIYSFEDGLLDRFNFLILSDPLCHDIDTLATSIKNCDSITTIFYDLIPLIFAKDYLKTAQTRLDYVKCLESLKVIDHFFAFQTAQSMICNRIYQYLHIKLPASMAVLMFQNFQNTQVLLNGMT